MADLYSTSFTSRTGASWSVREVEPKPFRLRDNEIVLLFECGELSRWMPCVRSVLRSFREGELRVLLEQATPMPKARRARL